MTGQRLRCAGVPKYDKTGSCWELAAWVVQQKGGTWVAGACRHHIHQVLKKNTAESGECTLWQADIYYRQRDALLARDPLRERTEAWLDTLRTAVQDVTYDLTPHDAMNLLADAEVEVLPTRMQALRLLEALVEEKVLEHTPSARFRALTPLRDHVEPGG